MHRDPQTGAVHMVLEYRCEGNPPCIVPPDQVQMLPDAFFKAACFGFAISLNKDLILTKDTTEVDLGLELKVPTRTALFHLGLLDNTRDYVIDKQNEEFYKVKLYFDKDKYEEGKKFKKGIPALKILPLPNEKFSFRYNRRS